jgi:hypothetical protein
MTVLFVTTMMPGARVTGSEVVSGTFIETMRRVGHRVIVLAYRRVGSNPETGADDVCVADRHIETKGAGLRPYWWMVRGVATQMPYSAAKYVTARFRERVAEILATSEPDLIVVDHAQMAWAVPRNSQSIIYIAHNAEHKLYADAAARAGRPMAWVNRRESMMIESVERGIAERASQSWVLSERDAGSLRDLTPNAEPVVFGMPPALGAIEAPGEIYDVATIGSWTWEANAAGLRWFVDRVVPLLPSGTRVGVAGAGAEEITAGKPGITYEGRVPDATRFLAKSRTIAVPSVAGAGVQIKSVDAIGTQMPVVATSFALRGLEDLPETVKTADEPADFAGAISDQTRTAPSQGDRDRAADWVRGRRNAFEETVAASLESVAGKPVAA